MQIFETFYKTAGRHDLKFGGDYTYAKHSYEAHFYESGYWQFTTDAPFDRNNAATWPIAFVQQTNGTYDYNSHILAAYAQDDWRVADRLRLNLGLRYDLDTNLRMNDVYRQVLGRPGLPRPRQLRQRRPRHRRRQPAAAPRRHLRRARRRPGWWRAPAGASTSPATATTSA